MTMVRFHKIAFSILLVVPWAMANAQSTSTPRFTFDEMIRVQSPSIEGLSPDGRWIAVTLNSQQSRLGRDHFRDNIPNGWFSSGELRVIDTRSGEAKVVTPGKKATSSVWSPSGDRLAYIEIRDETGDVCIWSPTTGKTTRLALPAGREVAGGSALAWHPGGTE